MTTKKEEKTKKLAESKLEGKKILITQPLIHGINGSTLVTLELAEYLQKIGMDVQVYTYTLDGPAKNFFEERQIRISSASEKPEYNLDDFDYIWIHSQVLPVSMVRQLGETRKNHTSFIFLHMSSMNWIPDEYPYIYGLEEKISSLSLYICEAVRKANLPFFEKEPKFDFYRNPAPLNFMDYKAKERSANLKSILFVSNYLPEEVLKAKEILRKKGYKVVSLGEGEDRHELISKEILNEYDAVVTIAKTTQYCLVSGKPVYVYGKFGGVGWLNDENYGKARETNFCGSSGCGFKEAKTIAKEIIDGFNDARNYQNANLSKFKKEYSIDAAITRILLDNNIKPKEITGFAPSHIESIVAAQEFAKIRFLEWSNTYRANERISDLQNVISSKSVALWLKFNRFIRGEGK